MRGCTYMLSFGFIRRPSTARQEGKPCSAPLIQVSKESQWRKNDGFGEWEFNGIR